MNKTWWEDVWLKQTLYSSHFSGWIHKRVGARVNVQAGGFARGRSGEVVVACATGFMSVCVGVWGDRGRSDQKESVWVGVYVQAWASQGGRG